MKSIIREPFTPYRQKHRFCGDPEAWRFLTKAFLPALVGGVFGWWLIWNVLKSPLLMRVLRGWL
jgi:hypothetical protein